jgi:hydroxyacylglutathione hydrolase
MGCGRLFEGTPAQMWNSLSKLKGLPPETRIYCGHEYTQSNARFALSIEPANPVLIARAKRVDALRARHETTIPGSMAEELATNPFLRADRKEMQQAMGTTGDVETFAAIRKAKDNF